MVKNKFRLVEIQIPYNGVDLVFKHKHKRKYFPIGSVEGVKVISAPFIDPVVVSSMFESVDCTELFKRDHVLQFGSEPMNVETWTASGLEYWSVYVVELVEYDH